MEELKTAYPQCAALCLNDDLRGSAFNKQDNGDSNKPLPSDDAGFNSSPFFIFSNDRANSRKREVGIFHRIVRLVEFLADFQINAFKFWRKYYLIGSCPCMEQCISCEYIWFVEHLFPAGVGRES